MKIQDTEFNTHPQTA